MLDTPNGGPMRAQQISSLAQWWLADAQYRPVIYPGSIGILTVINIV
jgi:hypothetical protein